MKNAWPNISDFKTSIDSLASTLNKKSAVSLETPRPSSLGLSGGEKNSLCRVGIPRIFCQGCQKVKQERLKWLADFPFYTKRFAFYIGRRCRDSTIQDVAQEFHLNWKTVKALEKQY